MKTKSTVVALLSAALCILPARAQDYQKNGPQTGALTPEQKARAGEPMPNQPAVSAAQEKLVSEDLAQVKGVIILPSEKEFAGAGVSGVTGTVVKGPAFLKADSAEVARVVAPYLNRPLTVGSLTQLQKDLIALCFKLDHPVVDVFYPPQEIVGGVFQVVVFEGKVGKVSVVNSGGKYFSEKFLTNQVRLKPGGSIIQSRLLADLNWLNQNPEFLEVDASYRPAPWDADKMSTADASTTDVELHVKDRPPIRIYGGYDDYGPIVLGVDRFFVGANYGNLFGVDQRLNYQYTTDINMDHFESHSASYIIPLPWRHTLTLYGGYDSFNANLPAIGFPGFQSVGETYQLSGRYTVPLPDIPVWEHEISAGFDYKYSDNNLEFNVLSVNRPVTEIDQFAGEYHGYAKEGRFGYLSLDANGFFSPGGLSGLNHTANFTTARAGAQEHYLYGKVDAEEGIFLPGRWLFVAKGGGQESTERLLPSEELSLGGNDTIRGYSERIVAGDLGYYATLELHTPIIRFGNITGQTGYPGHVDGDTIEFLGFYDYGAVKSKFQTSADDPLTTLESVGVGLRLNVSHNLAFRFDYGFQLRNVLAQDPINPVAKIDTDRSQMHASATLSF
jgi:hemolysin activation/secretion protein